MRIVEKWLQAQATQEESSTLSNRYDLYAARLFNDYEPLITSVADIHRDFFARLDKWLSNFKAEDDRWNAFRLIDDIFFVGRHELNELYRVAFDQISCDWLAGQAQLKYDDPKFFDKLEAAKNKTWFCPITDSLRINAFRHINHLSSPDYFPDWNSLAKFGDPKKIINYITKHVDYLVLVEDFIGTGTQVENAIKFVEQHIKIPVLVLPLIICPTGDTKLKGFVNIAKRRQYRPVLRLMSDSIIPELPAPGETQKTAKNRSVVERYRKITKDDKPYGFEPGFGSLVVMHTNCPNNTVRPIHAHTNKWSALFPRSKRVKAS